jgi:hypothetical protein
MTCKYRRRHYTCKIEPRQFDQACDKPASIGRTACLSPSSTSFSQSVTQSSSLNHIYHLFRIHLHYSLLHVLAITSQIQKKTKFGIPQLPNRHYACGLLHQDYQFYNMFIFVNYVD